MTGFRINLKNLRKYLTKVTRKKNQLIRGEKKQKKPSNFEKWTPQTNVQTKEKYKNNRKTLIYHRAE
jgi:hypothetical protein